MHAWTSKFYSNIKPLSRVPLFFTSPHPPNISPLHCSFFILFHTSSATPLYNTHHAQVLLASAITIMQSTAPATTCVKKIHFVHVHVTLKHSTLHKLTHTHTHTQWWQITALNKVCDINYMHISCKEEVIQDGTTHLKEQDRWWRTSVRM